VVRKRPMMMALGRRWLLAPANKVSMYPNAPAFHSRRDRSEVTEGTAQRCLQLGCCNFRVFNTNPFSGLLKTLA